LTLLGGRQEGHLACKKTDPDSPGQRVIKRVCVFSVVVVTFLFVSFAKTFTLLYAVVNKAIK